MASTGDVERLKRAARGANELCDVLWEALHGELDPGPPGESVAHPEGACTQRTAELARRLADIAATLVLLANADRRVTAAPDPDLSATATAAPSPAGDGAHAQLRPRPRPWDAPLPESSRGARMAAPRARASDEQGREKPAAHVSLIASALERFERDRLPFAVLVIEVPQLAAPRGVLRLAQLPRLLRQIESASSQALEAIGVASAASLALEGAGRLWLQVPETDRLGAQTAVQRLLDAFDVAEPLVAGTVAGGADPAERYFAALSAHAPPSGPRRNGARLELAIGSAVCPVDGQDVAALVDRASSELAVMRNGKRPGVALAGPA